MRPFWEVAILPVLTAVRPRVVVEIGALQGSTTTALLDELGPDAELHVIDPLPAFDPEEHAQRFPGRYVFHRDLSLNVLPGLPAADAAFIDGDHNWYTVYHELEQLAATAREAGKPLPVLLMHDVCWPYGRRDLYYDPDTIPAEFRQPYDRQGMKKGVAELVERGGMNPKLANAITEGGPRNGVLTALDDFIASYDRPVRRVILPFRFGLAIVVEQARLEREPELAAVLDELEPTGRQLEMLRRAEDLYLEAMTAHHALAFAPKPNVEAHVVRYLELLRDVLLDEHYLENELRNQYLLGCARTGAALDFSRLRDPARSMPDKLRRLQAARRVGRIAGDGNSAYPYFPYTSMGRIRLEHLGRCLDAVRADRVAGALVECGTGRGGGAIYMRGYCEARGAMRARHVWVADTFRATPTADAASEAPSRGLPAGGFPAMGADLNQVRDGFARFGLLDRRVHLLQGSYADTLADAPIAEVALLRIGDTLEGSPRVVLEALYDRLSVGGTVIVEGAGRQPAVEDFRRARGIDDPLERVDAVTVAWRKGAERPAAADFAPAPPSAHPLRRPPPVAPTPAPPERMALSVVVVFYDMRREAERTLHSLSRAYQEGMAGLDYEVIAVENGSAPDQELGEAFVRSFGPEFRYLNLGAAATPSPAHALNAGIAAARGETLALMIDGAHVLTPGVLHHGMTGIRTYAPAIVATQQWYVGPGQQHEAVHEGYDKAYEDRLFKRIGWPSRGYALFTIGHFIGDRDWLDGMGESNCLFVPRAQLEQVGGLDESFLTAGGGYANLELYERLGSTPGVRLVTILGEASFHQLHGGTTTNTPDPVARRQLLAGYAREYAELRGKDWSRPAGPQHYVGHMPGDAARTRSRRRVASVSLLRAVMSEDPDGFPDRPTLVPEDAKLEATEAYWLSLAWQDTRWLGHAVPKSPADLMAYQELVVRLRPDWIVETRAGATTLAPFLASICDLTGSGEILTVGVDDPAAEAVASRRVTSLTSPPTDEAAIATVRETVGESRAIVILGSRSAGRVMLDEFNAYSPLVPVGGYVVIEDTIVGGHPVWPGFGSGPADAVRAVVGKRDDFRSDRTLENYGPTFNPKGYLQRVAD